MTISLVIPLLLALGATPASTDARFGAVTAAPLPAGSLAVYATGGYPEFRGGFRQGLGTFEVAAEAGFNYMLMKVDAEGVARTPLFDRGALKLSLDAFLGGFANGGAQFEDMKNTKGAGVRFGAASTLTLRTSWPVSFYASAKLPVEIPLTNTGLTRLQVLFGGGAEVAIYPDYFLVFGTAFGPEYRRPSASAGYARLAVELMVGVGYRLF